eukprot:5549905-Pyramimonas_sp.AAC.1
MDEVHEDIDHAVEQAQNVVATITTVGSTRAPTTRPTHNPTLLETLWEDFVDATVPQTSPSTPSVTPISALPATSRVEEKCSTPITIRGRHGSVTSWPQGPRPQLSSAVLAPQLRLAHRCHARAGYSPSGGTGMW